MKLFKRIMFCFIWSLALFQTGCSMEKIHYIDIQKGMLDLTQWDFGTDRTISLNGEWAFYWNQLLTYKDLKSDSSLKPVYGKVPDTWTNYSGNGVRYSRFGFATYRLHVKSRLSTKTMMSISLKKVFSAYKLYINEEEIASNGRVAKSKAEYRPQYSPVTASFKVPSKDFDILLQVANFDYNRAGVWQTATMGTFNGINDSEDRATGEEMFIIGALVLSALYTTIIITINRASIMNIYFVIVCLMGIQIYDQLNQNFIYRIFPNFPFKIAIQVWYITGVWHPLFYALYLKNLFHLTSHKYTPAIITISSFLYSIFVMATPMSIYSQYGQLGDYILLFDMAYAVILISVALKQKKDGAFIYFVATGIMFVSSIYDYLYHMNIINSSLGPLSIVGFFGILLAHILIHAKFSRREYNEKVNLLEEVQNSKVTAIQNERKFLMAQIKPHFLFNALSVIASISEKDPVKTRKLIISLGEYLRNSFDFESSNEFVPIHKEIELVMAYVEIEKARFGELIQFETHCADLPEIKVPRLIIQPLVENAIRHGILKKPNGGTVKLIINQESSQIKIRVIDDGVGMDADRIECLLEEREETTGVGIKNIHARLIDIYGKGLSIKINEYHGISCIMDIPIDDPI